MTTSNMLDFGRVTARIRRSLGPIWSPLTHAVSFVIGSVFRFLIVLGIVFLVLAITVVEGTLAGHFGIYGITAVFIGVLGRAVAHWKIRESV